MEAIKLNKPYLILGKDDFILSVDLLSKTASEEVKSLVEQGFVVLFENCQAESSGQALKVWKTQKTNLLEYRHIKTSTANFILPNLEITENMGVITATVVAGTNILSDLFASFSDVFGGTSATYASEIDNIKQQALIELKKKAHELLCNAVINVSIDVDEISGNSKSMFMVTAVGTAVITSERQAHNK
jgi:uncharacterized protein YbjQ (UPF0145 family)